MTCHDLDVQRRRYINWVAYGIPESTRLLPEDAGGRSDDGNLHLLGAGYIGMAHERGQTHRYRFRLYALDTTLRFSSSVVDEQMLERAVAGHVLGVADLVGTYTPNPHMGGWLK